MRFGILGPVECVTAGGQLLVTGPRQQKLLAALLLEAGRTVSIETLIDVVWGHHAPATARNQIHTLVSRLRREFAVEEQAPRIVSGTAGYALYLDGTELDVAVFRDLVAQGYVAQERGDLTTAVETHRTALALWRGSALAGLDGDRLQALALHLEGTRLATTENMLRLLLRLGRAADVLNALPDAMTRHPLHEGLVELQMSALLHTGRRAEALTAYGRFRDRLADELGLDPRHGLMNLHRDILRDTAETPATHRQAIRRGVRRSRTRRTVLHGSGPRSRRDSYVA